MTYPHNRQVWRSNCEPAGDQYRAVARAIAQFEDVLLFCNTQELADKVRKVLDKEGGAERIYCHVAPSDDSWARDPGPTFVLDSFKRLVGIDWDFNAYGGEKEGCYWPCDKDKALCTKMCEAVAAQYGIYVGRHKVPLVLEGGSIHTDGEGTVLTTEECLLNPNRNPQLTKKEIEDHVLKALGCTKMIWLPHGVANDEDTNGHVDNWCMFARPGEVILSWCDDDSDENYKRCRESMAVLEKETDAKGRKLKVHKLPPPPPMVSLLLLSIECLFIQYQYHAHIHL
jgi:agmatine deiminase